MIAATRAIVAIPARPAATSAGGHAAEKESRVRAEGDRASSAPAARLDASRLATVLPMSPFVAQLIATHQAFPQTRARNRAEPADAALAYRDTRRRLAD